MSGAKLGFCNRGSKRKAQDHERVVAPVSYFFDRTDSIQSITLKFDINPTCLAISIKHTLDVTKYIFGFAKIFPFCSWYIPQIPELKLKVGYTTIIIAITNN